MRLGDWNFRYHLYNRFELIYNAKNLYFIHDINNNVNSFV